MNPQERSQTQTGMYLGVAGAVLGGLLLAAYILLLAFGLASNMANQRAPF